MDKGHGGGVGVRSQVQGVVGGGGQWNQRDKRIVGTVGRVFDLKQKKILRE